MFSDHIVDIKLSHCLVVCWILFEKFTAKFYGFNKIFECGHPFTFFFLTANLEVITLYPSSNSTRMLFIFPLAKTLHDCPFLSESLLFQNHMYSFIIIFITWFSNIY